MASNSVRYNADLASVYFFSNAGIVVIFSYLVLLLKEKGINETEIGVLAGAFSISYMVSNAFFGKLSDVRGRKPFLFFGLIASSVTTLVYIYPNSVFLFFIVRIINGIALGTFPASIIGTASDKNIKVGKLTAFGAMGWAFGGLAGGFIADYYDLDHAFLAASFFYLMAFFVVLVKDTGRTDNTNTGKINNKQPQYRRVIVQNWAVYLTFILRHGTANAIWIYWALFLEDDLNVSLTQLGFVQATNMITQFVFMSSIGDKYEPRKMVIVGGFISALAFYTFTIMEQFWEIIVSQIILGISWALFYLGSLRSIEINGKLDNTVSTGTGLLNACTSISMLLGPIIAILLFNYSNTYTLSMSVAAFVTTIATFLYILFEYRKSS